MQRTRRRFLQGSAGLLAAGAAGCVDGIGESPEESDDAAYTSFFTLEKFADAVAGDALTVENPVPVGTLGHHYEVSTQSQLDVARSRAFVYVGLPGFQRWAVDTAANLREDHPEVTLVDAAEGIDLLEATGRHEADGHDGDDGGGDHRGNETDDHHENETGGDDGHDHEDGDHGDEHDGDHEDGEHDDGGGHDHGDFDPHFWLDPVRAATCVETVRDGLMEADEDDADAYESNAADYLATLSELDETFRTELEDRELDTVVVASHDSYGYLADRYGFEVHSPVGVSPNAEPSSSEISDTIDVVDEHGIDVVLHDVFESPNLAETVVADSSAAETRPISPVAGTTQEWHDDGWGYVEQMKEINLPALKAALNAE